MPSGTGTLFAVLYLTNKRRQHGRCFTKEDVGNLQTVFHSAGDILHANQQFKNQNTRVRQLQDLLNITAVDADDITLPFLSDSVVKLTGGLL